MNNSKIGLAIAIGMSFFILFSRKKKWLNPKIIWLICIGLFTFGIYGFLFSKNRFENEQIMNFGFLVPLIYWTFDRVFKKISEKIHNRDFILYLAFSDEIDDMPLAKNPEVKTSDKLFSIGLLIIIIGTLLIGIGILK